MDDVPMDPQDGSQNLAQMMALMMSRMDDMRAEQASEREAMRMQIRVLQENVASLQATPVATPQTPTSPALPGVTAVPPAPPGVTVTPPSPPAQTKKKMILPDPPRFDGNRKKYRNWRLEMEGKLRTDGCFLGSPTDQFTYIYSRLGDSPQSMAAAFYESGGPGGTRNPTSFLQYLTTTYEDPNVAQHALNNLDDMTQGKTESFAAFYPRFERQLADAGGATWDDAIQINYLRKALNEEMKDLLIPMLHLPKDYPGFTRELHSLGANIEARRATQKRAYRKAAFRPQGRNASPDRRVAKHQNHERAATPPPDTMDWEPTKISKAVQRQNKDLAGKRAKWVDEKETALRIKEKRCLRCGRDSCWISECPLLPPRRPNPPARAHVKKSRPKLPEVEDLVDTEDDSSVQTETDDEKLKE